MRTLASPRGSSPRVNIFSIGVVWTSERPRIGNRGKSSTPRIWRGKTPASSNRCWYIGTRSNAWTTSVRSRRSCSRRKRSEWGRAMTDCGFNFRPECTSHALGPECHQPTSRSVGWRLHSTVLDQTEVSPDSKPSAKIWSLASEPKRYAWILRSELSVPLERRLQAAPGVEISLFYRVGHSYKEIP